MEIEENLDNLPAFPASRAEFERWSQWSQECHNAKRVPTLNASLDELKGSARAQVVVSWRAIIAHWSEQRSVAPDDSPLVAYHVLWRAHELPPFVFIAARRLLEESLRVGATSTDVLFLCAAFAWPLRDVAPAFGALCWEYMVHAPWQTDALSLKDLLTAVDHNKAFGDGRNLMDLVEHRMAAGRRASARELLEAVVLVQSRRRHMDQILSYRDFAQAPLVQGSHEALVRLAELYKEERNTQVHAREVMKRAAELTRAPRMIELIETTVWNRPIDEAYVWCDKVTHPRMLDHEIERALLAKQPHHARRLAEAVMVRKYNRLWYGSALDNVSGALERFQRQLKTSVPSDPVARRAAEHLATLYVRSKHVTQHARHFVHDVASSIAFVGEGAMLHPIKSELELFYNTSDPYHLMRRDVVLMHEREHALLDDEKRASDRVDRWFSDRFRQDNPTIYDRIARLLTTPLVDAGRMISNLPLIESALDISFRTMIECGGQIAGDLSAISKQAAIIRSQYGHGVRLMEYAKRVSSFEPIAGAATSMLTSFFAPSFNLAAHVADLGASLMLTFRAIARIAAVFGRNMENASGFQLVADTFALGLSSTDGEGLVTYLSREEEQLLTSFSIGAVGYGSARLVEYLWTAPNRTGDAPSMQAIRHLSRLCGVELADSAIVRVVPIVGAVISGVSTYAFMRSVIDAAIHVAARDALMVRVHAYEDQ